MRGRRREAPGSKAMSRSSIASLAREFEMSETSGTSEMSEPRRWWGRPVISPFLNARGAAWVAERREMAATVMAAEESFMLMIDWCFWLMIVVVVGVDNAGYVVIDVESRLCEGSG